MLFGKLLRVKVLNGSDIGSQFRTNQLKLIELSI